MTPLVYWIYFEKYGVWRKIICKDFLDFLEVVRRLTAEANEPPQQIIRTYL